MDEKWLPTMIEKLKQAIEPEEDSVRIYSLCARCEKKILVIGTGEVMKEPEVYIV